MRSTQVLHAGCVSSPALVRARTLLDEARCEPDPARRFSTAHLAALRATGALQSSPGVRASHAGRNTNRRPSTSGRRPVNAWALVRRRAPELSEFADRFAAAAGRRALVEAGASVAITAAEADAEVLAARRFFAALEDVLGATAAVPAGALPMA